MAEQSTRVAVLLTRPSGQSARFAAELQARFGAMRLVESPLIAPEFLPVKVPSGQWTGVIFTSETGVEAARRLKLLGLSAFAVGARSAAAARAAGFAAEGLGEDADDLVAALLSLRPKGPLLHLHGEDTRGDVAARLTTGGVPTVGVALYAQRARPLTAEARQLLAGNQPVVVPLFSPRTAALFSAAVATAAAPLWVAALSPAVAEATQIVVARRAVADRPTSGAMLDAIDTLLTPSGKA